MELDFRKYCLCGIRFFCFLFPYLENMKGIFPVVVKLLTRATLLLHIDTVCFFCVTVAISNEDIFKDNISPTFVYHKSDYP